MIRKHHHQPGRGFQLLQRGTTLSLSAFLQTAVSCVHFHSGSREGNIESTGILCITMSLWIICSPRCLWKPAGKYENLTKHKALGEQGCFLLVLPCEILAGATLPWLQVCFYRAGIVIQWRVAVQLSLFRSKSCWGVTGNSKPLLHSQLLPQGC